MSASSSVDKGVAVGAHTAYWHTACRKCTNMTANKETRHIKDLTAWFRLDKGQNWTKLDVTVEIGIASSLSGQVRQEGSFWGASNLLFLDLGTSYTAIVTG